MDVSFLISLFRLYPGTKVSLRQKSARKILLSSACFFLDSRFSLCEIDQKFKFVGTIGYCDSYSDSFFRHFKVFRLDAILDDAARAVTAHSGRGLGYFYMIGQGPNSSSIGHVTGLLFCLYVKVFLPSIFKSVKFWSSMSCIALDIERADKNVIGELGVFNDGNDQVYSFLPPIKYKPTK